MITYLVDFLPSWHASRHHSCCEIVLSCSTVVVDDVVVHQLIGVVVGGGTGLVARRCDGAKVRKYEGTRV